MNWAIIFFKNLRGDRPVQSFISSLDVNTRVKIDKAIGLLQSYGPKLLMPHSKKIASNLYELRIRGQIEIRIFYTIQARSIYLLHIFQKKTQRTPIRELEIALYRLKLLDVED